MEQLQEETCPPETVICDKFYISGMRNRETRTCFDQKTFPKFITPPGILQDPIKGTEINKLSPMINHLASS